nr:DinB family protein [Cellulomonas sp. APG4]
MAEEYVRTGQFRGATFRQASFAGAEFREVDLSGVAVRDSDLRGVRLASCAVDGLVITGIDGMAGEVVVDDVPVGAFVASELDRRFPERVRLRAVRTADDVRAMWAQVEELWAGTLGHAAALPDDALHRRVDGEWSFVETLRHLVYVVDTWVGLALQGRADSFHPWALPQSDLPDDAAAAVGLDRDARPAFDDVVALVRERWGAVRHALDEVTDGSLDEQRTVRLPGEDDAPVTVRRCVGTVLREHVEHRRFAERDLAALAR